MDERSEDQISVSCSTQYELSCIKCEKLSSKVYCTTKHRWGSFANEENGFEELDAATAYRISLKTWANWVDSTIDPNKTRVFFTTMSPTHMRFV